jgi:hypothetical protein
VPPVVIGLSAGIAAKPLRVAEAMPVTAPTSAGKNNGEIIREELRGGIQAGLAGVCFSKRSSDLASSVRKPIIDPDMN